MTDLAKNPPILEQVSEVAVEERRGISIVWLIPLIALLIGAWLAYKTISEKGPTITITFEDGAGLEAGKTKIKYKSVEVGKVGSVDLSEDLTHVTVTAELVKGAKSHLTENTQFWVVRPRVGVGGISGLETLVSGAYISIDPRPGTLSSSEFTGLEKPPGVTVGEAGAQYRLRTHKLGSLHPGAPIFFRDIEVGRVLNHELAKDEQSVFINVFIQAPHHLRVRDTSRFWKTSGLEVSMGADGVDVKMESLASLIAGGVAFDTPVTAAGGSKPSRSGTVFELFESFKSLGESKYVRSIPYLTYFNGSVRGLSLGAPVEFRGIKVGSVTDVAIEFNEETLDARIPVIIEIEPERVSTQIGDNKKEYEILDILVQRGLRAQLQTGSLLTGQLFVELEIFPKLPPKALIMTGKYPEIPTVPSTMDELQSTVSDVMADIRKLPLDKIAQELLGTMKGANRLANSPELLQSVRKVSTVLDEVQTLTRDVDQAVVGVADPDSPAMVNLSSSLEELSAAARSIRELADYLERHPESLVRGKSY